VRRHHPDADAMLEELRAIGYPNPVQYMRRPARRKEPVKLPGRNPCDTDGPDGTCAQCIITDRLTAEREAEA
jgi:hypothetical protein